MSKFRSAHRTIVTEIKSFIVDTVSRSGTFRQSVSAKVPDQGSFHKQDINVSEDSYFEIEGADAVLGLTTPEPVRVVLIQTSKPVFEEPDDSLPAAEFVVPESVFAGNDLPITLRDMGLASLAVINVTAMNITTGETETVILRSVASGVFEGVLPTELSVDYGTDFDGIMSVGNRHTILLRHNDISADEVREVEILAESPYVDSELSSIDIVFPGRTIPVSLVDADLESSPAPVVVNVVNQTTGETMELTMAEVEPGAFVGQLPTSGTSDLPGTLFVSPGDTVSVSYSSPLYADTPSVEHTIAVQGPGHVDVSFVVSDTIYHGSSKFILNDYNQAGSSSANVIVSNSRSREYVMVVCSEVIPNSGIFIGDLKVQPGATSGDTLGANSDDVLSYVYVDTAAPSPVRLETNAIVSPSMPASPSTMALDGSEDFEPIELQENHVEFLVDGLFFLNGSFTGTLRVYGLKSQPTRCSILHA